MRKVQRRRRLYNGVLFFDDTGELLPNGQLIAPHRPGRGSGVNASKMSTPGRLNRRLLHLGGLICIAGWEALASGVLRFGTLYGVQWPPRAFHIVEVGQVVAAAAVFFWLSLRVIDRTTLDRIRPGRRLLHRGIAVATGAAAIYTSMPAAGLERVGLAVFGCAVAWLALEVCKDHGLALDQAGVFSGRAEVWEITQRAFVMCAVGGAATFLLRWPLGLAGVPVMAGQQLAETGITGPLDLVCTVVWAAAIEDVVMVAAVTVLLPAARRPLWQTYATVCLLEILVHAYFGLPAIGMSLYAAGRVWLYLRYGRLAPMVVGHIALDLVAALNQTLPLACRLLSAVLLVSLMTLIDLWVKRSGRTASRPDGVTS